MPKYILHGGKEECPSPMNDDFYRQLALETPEGGQCVIAYFAWEPEEWSAFFERDSKRILGFAADMKKNIVCICASLDNFEAEVEASDVIYFFGGNSVVQMEHGKKFKSLLLKDKVFAGSSSGAYLMGRKFRTTRTTEVLEGTGVLPFNIQAHADNPQYMSFKNSLMEVSNADCPLVSIREGEFIMVEH